MVTVSRLFVKDSYPVLWLSLEIHTLLSKYGVVGFLLRISITEFFVTEPIILHLSVHL